MNKKRLIGISAIACFVLAVVSFAWSLTNGSVACLSSTAVHRCEKQVQCKQQTAEAIAQQLLSGNNETVPDSDIAVFYFVNGQLKNWTNTDIPVAEQELATLDTLYQFTQLGYSQYLTKACRKDSALVVTAILLKQGYSYDNAFLVPKISSFLAEPDIIDVISVSSNEQNTIHAIDGKPLFSVVFTEGREFVFLLICRWLSVALFIVGLFLLLFYYTAFLARLVAIGLLVLLRCALAWGKALFETSIELFSSTVYADSSAIPSLGSLLLHALFLFLIVVILLQQFKQSEARVAQHKSRILFVGLLLSACFMGFIQYVFRSLILNSTIPFDFSQLDLLTGYTFVAYGVLILLYATLYLLLYMALSPQQSPLRRFESPAYLLIFIISMAVYTLGVIEIYGHQQEEQRAKALADKLATEHDPAAELLLDDMAKSIGADEKLKKAILAKEHPDDIHRYLTQHYFNGYMQYYDLQLTVCPRGTMLRIDTVETDCHTFFTHEISKYGTLISDQSVFYYLANDNGRNSYIGFLTYTDSLSHETDIFLELDSKLRSGGEGYPELLIEKGVGNKIKMPAGYSYAKYADGRLIAAGGEFRYPYDNKDFFKGDKVVEDGYAHLLFSQDSQHVIIVSRHTHTFWSLLVLFSYLFFVIGFGVVILLALGGLPFNWAVSKNTFQRKITILLILAFVISILCVGAGTLWYNLRQFRKNALTQMENKVHTVLTQLDYYLNNIPDIRLADRQALNAELVRLSNSMHIDVNLYDTTGRLLISSRMEIFDKQLQPLRINRVAFESLHTERLSEFIHKENLGDLTFYSVYATYFNVNGRAIAYVNVPYFAKRLADIREASAVITTMVNVYILLLFIVLLIGAALANRMLRPLEIVRRNMQRLDVTKKLEYIRYDEKDELGDLIRAYNQMVKALEESTQQLAQSEREGAWREMARQIAHEIKNPLTPMRLSIQHLVRLKKDKAPDWTLRFDDLAASLLEQIDTLAKTASEFSSFAKTSTDKATSVSLNALIKELRPLFDIHKTILFEWNDSEKEAIVSGHSDQLSRVLVNLLNNAVQAVQDIPNGKIRVSLSDQSDYYAISVEDNGGGVRSDLQEKLFTPNFTTKGSGTGLGLAISKKNIEQEGGRIVYALSDLGGACFTIYLPKKNNDELSF